MAFLVGVAIAACLMAIAATVYGVDLSLVGVSAARIPARRMLLAGVSGVAGLVFTGLPVGFVVGAALGWWVPGMIAEARARRAAIVRTEAVATWTRQVADTMTGSSPVNAIRATATTAPQPIAAQVRQLAYDVTRMPFGQAVVGFARSLDDASAEVVVVALNAANSSGGAAAKVLVELAEAADLHADMRRRMDVARAALYTRARIITGVFVVGLVMARIVDPSVLATFRSAVGQLVLAATTAMFVLSYVWLGRMSRADQPESVLAPEPAT